MRLWVSLVCNEGKLPIKGCWRVCSVKSTKAFSFPFFLKVTLSCIELWSCVFIHSPRCFPHKLSLNEIESLFPLADDVACSTLLLVNIQFLYRIRTARYFEKIEAPSGADTPDTTAIQHIYMDEDSRMLAVAASQYIVLYSFKKKEITMEVPVSSRIFFHLICYAIQLYSSIFYHNWFNDVKTTPYWIREMPTSRDYFLFLSILQSLVYNING